jgi:phosphomannomutase
MSQTLSALSPAARETLRRWREEPEFAAWRSAAEAAASSAPAELEEAFGTELQFGTGGMRGPCGPGPGRMNAWVVAKATQGLANYLHSKPLPAVVVVGHDARNGSREFAEITARVLAANRIAVRLFEGLCVTPQMSHSVRKLGAGAGVMITASHNPPADNGYKCYQAAGCQFAPPEDASLVYHVGRAAPPALAELPTLEAARASGLLTAAPESLRAEYVAAAVDSSRIMSVPAADRAAVGVLYSPFHGVGSLSVLPALQAAGVAVRLLEPQARPDPNFPTLPKGVANPEEPPTFWRLLCAARDSDDILLASDPDADRIGAMVRRRPGGEWIYLDGNRLMALLCDFAVRRWHVATGDWAVASGAERRGPVGHTSVAGANGKGHIEGDGAKLRGVVSRTIVTTALVDRIAETAAPGRVDLVNDLLVGLKYQGRLIDRVLAEPSPRRVFVFGGEEAHGYLSGEHSLDKDAANAACLLAGPAAECKAAGRTVWQHLLGLYRRFGLFANGGVNLSLTAAEGGMARARAILDRLRAAPPATLAGRAVVAVIDHHKDRRITVDRRTGRREEVPFDPGNVLTFVLSDDGLERVTVRPSGTEPKMKLYGQLVRPLPADSSDDAAEGLVESAERELSSLLAAAMGEMKSLG